MEQLPLSTLLSQALIAYTIEFDNEFEQRFPHSMTTRDGAGIHGGKPWLVSQVMWTNYLRFVGDDGTSVAELQARACVSKRVIASRLHHLEWWYYVTHPDPAVHLSPGGARAVEVWRPLNAEIDARWRARLGKAASDRLTKSLRALVVEHGAELPDYMPVVDYGDGLRAAVELPASPPPSVPVKELDLSALLSRALLALTLEFEERSDVSLTIAADVMRVLEDEGTPLKEIPARGGVTKEGVQPAVTNLKKKELVTIGPEKAKTVRLTPAGQRARGHHAKVLADIETEWGGAASLRAALEAIPLAEGLVPPAGAWRTMKPYAARMEAVLRDPRAALPHHPMVLHRGGYPDGS
jgi:hypothetical protein